MSKDRNELTFEEMSRARAIFMAHAEENVSDEYVLRIMLSELGQYPSERELNFVLDLLERAMSFNSFCNYLAFLKSRYQRPEPRDVDTVRAFVALGGQPDRSGDISTEDLRQTCKHFELTIDIDRMLREVDEDGSGSIDYKEFAHLWKQSGAARLAAYTNFDGDDEVCGAIPTGARPEEGDDASSTGERSLSRKSSMRADTDAALDDDENLILIRQYIFPLQRKATAGVQEVLAKRKSQAKAGARKSVIRLPSLYPGSAAVPGRSGLGGANATSGGAQDAEARAAVTSDADSGPDDVGGGGVGPGAAAAAASPGGASRAPRHSTYRPPSPQILDFRRSRRTPRLPTLTPRAAAHQKMASSVGGESMRTPRTGRR